MTEKHKTELYVLKKTQAFKKIQHEVAQDTKRRNFTNTMLAEERYGTHITNDQNTKSLHPI